MKKRVGKVKKFIAMLMVGVTLSSSVFYAYSIPAQATAIVPTAQGVLEALITLFGYSLGYGRSADGFSSALTPDILSSAVDSALSGTGAVELGNYGSVDFSDEVALFDFLKNAYTVTSHILAIEAYDKVLSKYDYVSYKNSGVSSTKTMNEILGDIVSKYETDGTAALKEDIQQAFTVISGGAGSGNDDDDDDDESSFTPLSWRIISALMAAFTTYGALPKLEDGTDDESALAVPEESEYVLYEDFLKNHYFTGYEDMVELTAYSDRTWYAETGEIIDSSYFYRYEPFDRNNRNIYLMFPSAPSSSLTGSVNGHFYAYPSNLSIQIALIKEDGSTSRRYFTEMYCIGDYRTLSDEGVYYGWVNNSFYYDTNVPVFETEEAAAAFFSSGDASGMLNGYSETKAVEYFTETPSCTVPEYVINFMTKSPSTQEVTDLAAALSALPTDAAGTSQYIPTIEQAVQEATDALPDTSMDVEPSPTTAPEEDVEQEQDPDTGNLNYFNILQLILNAIKGIAETVWSFFENPMASIVIGITNLIELIPGCFELVRGWIEALPGSVFGFFEAPLLAIQEALAVLNPFESWWPRLQPYLDQFLALFQSAVPEADLTDPDIPTEDNGGNGKHSFDLLSLLNGLWLLIMILIMLLSIFLHLMIFIINIFKIPASTGYLNDDMILGLNYIKTLEITGIGLSVYDFMMGLVYILMVFGVVKVLRHNINHIKVPKAIRGGLY